MELLVLLKLVERLTKPSQNNPNQETVVEFIIEHLDSEVPDPLKFQAHEMRNSLFGCN